MIVEEISKEEIAEVEKQVPAMKTLAPEAGPGLTLESIGADVLYALRLMRRAPAFAIIVILTIALGIGANTAIFTLIHSILLQSLPVPDLNSLYRIGDRPEANLTDGLQNDDGDFDLFSYNLYRYLRDATPEFASLAAMESGADPVSIRRGSDTAKEEPSEFVSGNYFKTFGVGAFAGRMLTDADDTIGAPPAVVMSYQSWRSDFAGDPSVIGATFYIQSQPVTVVGIAPSGFYGDRISSNPPALFIPLSVEPLLRKENSTLTHSDENWLYLMGRLRPGVQTGQLEQKISANLRNWIVTQDAYAKNGIQTVAPKLHVVLTPGGAGIQDLQKKTSKELYLLLILSGFVLLVACANVANLLLARGTKRRTEISTRIALGAARSRLIRQMLTESILLGFMGGIAGIAVAFAGTQVILALAFPGSTHSAIHAMPSIPVLGFAFFISLLTGVVFGIVPAWIASNGDPAEVLKGVNRTAGDKTTLPQRCLIVVQAALSLVVLAGAGMLIQSLANLEHQDFGLETANRYVLHLNPQDAGYGEQQLDSMNRALEQQLAQIPGIDSVGLALFSPLDGNPWGYEVFIPGRPAPGPNDNLNSLLNRVNPDYFRSVGQHLVRGRIFTLSDTANSPAVAVVNQAFVKKFFPGEDPIGRHFGNYGPDDAGAVQIVGVVSDARYSRPKGGAEPMFFRPLTQWQQGLKDPTAANIEAQTHFISSIVMSFHGVPRNLGEAVRRSIASVNPNLAVIDLQSLDAQLRGNFNQERLIARLTTLFGLLTLLLAAVGLYGITSYQVTQKTREIGLRMAFGADRTRVLNMVMRGALMQVGIGLAIGVPLVLYGARYVQSQLYMVKPYDPLSLTAAAAVLIVATAVAGFIPARRAASIDPMRALRNHQN